MEGEKEPEQEPRPARALLLFFSGTGNTLTVAKLIRDSFLKRNVQTDIFEISNFETKDAVPANHIENHLDEYNLIGFGYPIYAFNTPLIFLRYVKKLAPQNKKVFIFKTSGEPTFFNHASSHALKKLLRRCTVLGDYHFLMPYNIVFRFPDNLMKQMYCAAKQYSEILAANILSGKTSFVHYNFFHRFISLIFKIQRPGAYLNGRLHGVKQDRCTLCLRCVRDCPAKNIRWGTSASSLGGRFRWGTSAFSLGGRFRPVNRRLHFGWRCVMCMRCALLCPRDAVTIGLLNGWRVNGPFGFEALEKDGRLDGRFINEKTRGLYRIYIPWFKKLDELRR